MTNNNTFDQQIVESICQSLIPKMQSLEDDRINVVKRLKKFRTITLFIVVGVVAIVYLLRTKILTTDNGMMWTIGAAIALIVGILIFYSYYVSVHLKAFRNRFKDEVIRVLLTTFLPGANFQPDKHISMDDYCGSALFTKAYDRYSGKNYVSGVLDKTSIRFSQLHTEYKTETRTKNGGRQTHWHTIFRGIFMIADPNKNFKGQTYILPDFGERYFGGLGKWFQKNLGDLRGKVVYMENPAFEKKFAVYSTDPVEARYLITPQMQERMLALAKHVSEGVCASFVNGKLYLAISKGASIFEANTDLSLLDVKNLKYYSRDITDMLSIVHILDLNTRIWGR